VDHIQLARHIQRLWISNSYSESVTLCLEPWAYELPIPPKVSFEIVAEGPGGDYLEVAYEELRITAYGWSGSVLSVFHEGQLLLECNIPVPPSPFA
jgi:hypothetical protein